MAIVASTNKYHEKANKMVFFIGYIMEHIIKLIIFSNQILHLFASYFVTHCTKHFTCFDNFKHPVTPFTSVVRCSFIKLIPE